MANVKRKFKGGPHDGKSIDVCVESTTHRTLELVSNQGVGGNFVIDEYGFLVPETPNKYKEHRYTLSKMTGEFIYQSDE